MCKHTLYSLLGSIAGIDIRLQLTRSSRSSIVQTHNTSRSYVMHENCCNSQERSAIAPILLLL